MNNYYQSQYPMIQPQYYYQQPQQQLNCKIVENVDSVKYQEVPIGGFSVFIKADMSEVYTKSWNSDGTTQVNTYFKADLVNENESDPYADVLSKIQTSIEELSKKIDGTTSKAPATAISRTKKGA